MDINQQAKQRVLQQIMDMMDERSLSDLKNKSPKFAKIDIQSDDPKLAETLKDKLVNGIQDDPEMMEDKMEDPSKEMSKADFKEDMAEGENPMNEQDHENPEDMERLLEMYRKLK